MPSSVEADQITKKVKEENINADVFGPLAFDNSVSKKSAAIKRIKNEKDTNPRLQVKSVDEYVEIMNGLKLSNPKMMDIAVPANQKGLTLKDITK